MRIISFLFLFFVGCSYHPINQEWREAYRHLKSAPAPKRYALKGDWLICSVDAPHFDTSSPGRFLRTLAKHPASGAMEGRFGHAWVTLVYKGSSFTCGYSGEIDRSECGYFERLIDLAEAGDPNPARALFETREDGFLQSGSGGHSATYSIGVPLKEEAAEQILTLMQQQGPGKYSITKSQCVTFVLKIAEIAGLDLEAEVSLTLPSDLPLKGGALHLFSDPEYATFTFLSPDRLEKSMMEAVKEGRAVAIKTPKSFRFKGCTLERAKILFSVQGLP